MRLRIAMAASRAPREQTSPRPRLLVLRLPLLLFFALASGSSAGGGGGGHGHGGHGNGRFQKRAQRSLDVARSSERRMAPGLSNATRSGTTEYDVILRIHGILGGSAIHSEVWFCVTGSTSSTCSATGYGMDGSRMFTGVAHPTGNNQAYFYNTKDAPKQSLTVGTKKLSKEQLDTFVQQMRVCGNWGLEYNLLTHNCNSYSRAVMLALGFDLPEALQEARETKVGIKNRFLGHWLIDSEKCAGSKCLKWAMTIGCNRECTWAEKGCMSETGEVEVDDNNFNGLACGWSIDQLHMKDTLDKWSENAGTPDWSFKSAKTCVNKKGEKQPCCAQGGIQNGACDFFECARKEERQSELRKSCVVHKGLNQCLPNLGTCSHEFTQLGLASGLVPRDKS